MSKRRRRSALNLDTPDTQLALPGDQATYTLKVPVHLQAVVKMLLTAVVVQYMWTTFGAAESDEDDTAHEPDKSIMRALEESQHKHDLALLANELSPHINIETGPDPSAPYFVKRAWWAYDELRAKRSPRVAMLLLQRIKLRDYVWENPPTPSLAAALHGQFDEFNPLLNTENWEPLNLMSNDDFEAAVDYLSELPNPTPVARALVQHYKKLRTGADVLIARDYAQALREVLVRAVSNKATAPEEFDDIKLMRRITSKSPPVEQSPLNWAWGGKGESDLKVLYAVYVKLRDCTTDCLGGDTIGIETKIDQLQTQHRLGAEKVAGIRTELHSSLEKGSLLNKQAKIINQVFSATALSKAELNELIGPP